MKIALRKRKLKKRRIKLYLDIYKGYEIKNGKHLPYEKSASMYVAKFICDTKTNWGIVKK